MNASQLQQLERALSEHPELQALIDLPEQRVMNRLLRRAALPRSFDQRMFAELLATDLGEDQPPSFEKFVASSEIERVAYTRDRFALRDNSRTSYLAEWTKAEPEAIRDWAGRLLAHYGDSASSLDVVDTLIRIDQRRARAEFVRLYNDADARFDLARCYALLDILRTRSAEIDPETHALKSDRETLYGARVLYAEEFQQTVDYFRRPAAQRELRRVVHGRTDGKWIFHLHGPGGMGKSMTLRWMVSHRLITRRMRVLCVRLDFDALSVSAVASLPGLLALPIAEQLDSQVQLTGTKLIIARMQSYRRLLRKSNDQVSGESDEALRGVAVAERVSALQETLAPLPVTRPILFVLDTIEEASSHQPEGLLRIIEFFALLRQSLPQVRLVLAGRYALGVEQMPQYAARFAAETVVQEFSHLSAEETRAFFSQLVPDASREMTAAVVARSDGNPFKLNMLSEIIAGDPTITPERLLSEEFEHVDVAYLLQRVIMRIPAADELPVRWVLRYGAIPRHLTRDFVEKVLLDPLSRALAGTAQDAGDDMVGEAISSGLWIPRTNVTITVDNLWKQLAKYSSTHGWISVDKSDPNTATLHADILNPTRRLLSKQAVFKTIQARAIDYFERRGAIVDVLFHQTHLDETAIAKTWADAFKRGELRNDPARCRTIAEDLLGRDFAEVPADAKLVAHREAIEAMAAQNGYVFLISGVDFDVLLAHANAAEMLRQEAYDTPFPESISACLLAVSRFRANHRTEAQESLAAYWAAATERGDRARAALHLAEMAIRSADAGAELWLKHALDADADGEPGAAPRRFLHQRLADVYGAARQWDKARAEMQLAAARARADSVTEDIIRFSRRLIEWDIQTNQWQEGYAQLESLDPDRDRSEYVDLRAQLATATLRPEDGIRFASAALLQTKDLEHARMLLTYGDALQQAMRISDAIAAYQESGRECEERGDVAGVDFACSRELMLHVRSTGNLVAVGQILGSQELHTPDLIARTQWDLARAWRALESGARESALKTLKLNDDATPENAYRLANRLSLGIDEHFSGRTLRRLLRSLDSIQPPAARLSVFGDLAVPAAWPKLGQLETRRLLVRFPFRPKGPLEAAPQALLRAELLRALRRYRTVLALLDQYLPATIDLTSPSDVDLQPLFWYRLRLERAVRVETALDARRCADRLRSRVEGARTLLAGAIALELANVAAAIDDRVTARRLYLAAAEGCGAEKAPTVIHALRMEVGCRLGEVPPDIVAAAYRALGQLRRARQFDDEAAARIAEQPPASAAIVADPPASAIRIAKVPPFAPAIPRDPDLEDNDILGISLADASSFSVAHYDRPGHEMIRPTERRVRAADWLLPFTESIGRGAATAAADRFARDWQSATRGLAEILREGMDPLRVRIKDPERVFLDLPPDLAALPWELAKLETQPRISDRPPRIIRWIGPASQDAASSMVPTEDILNRLRRRPALSESIGAGSSRVIVLIDSASAERAESGFAYTKLVAALDRPQVALRVITEGIRRLDSIDGADLIVVVSSLLDSAPLRSAALLLDRTTSRHFGQTLATVRSGPARPAVILDVPRPQALIETAQQLLARNRFAHELMCTGQVAAVLATGLGGDQGELQLFETIGHAIQEGFSSDETLLAIRQLDDSPREASDLAGSLPFAGTALFTNSPASMLAPRGAFPYA